ncbi:unnamed protein product [Closterium sp. Naga37s-1]|nr:unnamed protein product [Closterium sp. Naga37s-1]
MISDNPLLVGRPDILTWKEAIEPQLEMTGLISFARGTVATSEEIYPDLRADFRAVQLLTFTVNSRCCSPGVQIALKSCREYLDAGHRAWHFIESTYQVTDDLFIGQLEGQLTHIRMGDQETATDYCNRARQILATLRMAGMQYSTASTRATLNEDTLTSYILQDEAMQEAERSQELLAHVNYVTPAKQGGRPGQRGQHGGGGSSGWKPVKDADKQKSATGGGRGGGSWHREFWLCVDLDHLSFESPYCNNPNDDDAKGGQGRSAWRRPRRESKPRKEKQSTKSASAKDADSPAAGKGRDGKVASCSLAPEAGEDFHAVAAAVQANPAVVLLDSGCSHHMMGTRDVFVDLQPSVDVKHVRGFNGALKDVWGRGTVALQGEAGKQVLILDVLYVPGVRANLLLAGQLKENGVKLQKDGDGMFLVSAAGDVLGRASYTGLVHVGMDTIRSSTKHEVANGLDLKSASGADSPCVSCVGGKLTRHTFPDQGSDADDVLAVVHIDLCGPFRVAAKDGSLYFLLLKDRKIRYVWVRPVAKKSDALQEFVRWLAVAEQQTKKSVLMLRSDRGGEFLGKQFTDFVNGNGIVHDLTCPYTPQQNGMPEREMFTVVESVRTTLLHMGVQHHWWHLSLRQAVWVRNCLERSTLPPGTRPYQLLTGKKLDLSLARVWVCMAQFLVPEQQHGGKLKSKARWGLHLGVLEESKGWELLNIVDNRVVTTSYVVFYQHMSLEDVGVVRPSSPPPVPPAPPLVADLHGLTPVSASGDEGRSGESPVAPAKSIAGSDLTSSKSMPPDFYVPAAFTKAYDEVDDDLLYDDAKEDEELPELDPDMHAVPEHHWDISSMTVKEALASWKGKAVKVAMEEEIRSLITMGTWELVERPLGVNITKNRWVLTTKYRIDDTVERENARLVVKGFTQVYGADYDETYAPVDEALYFKVGDEGVACWVLAYVDDLLAAGSSTAMLKELLEVTFELREISPVQKYLGLEIVRDRPARKLWLHQQGYADKLHRRFIDEEQIGRNPKTPVSVDAYAELTFVDEEVQERQEEEYRQKVGSLQFAATTTRPDIAFACSKLGSGLTFGGGPETLELVGYVDADDAGNKQNRTSMSGNMFVYGGVAVSWSSQRIKCATLSSTESEYVVDTEAGKEGRHLRFLADFR